MKAEEKEKYSDSIGFVARFWRRDAFSASRTLKRAGIVPAVAWWRSRVAAAVAALVVLGASAAVFIYVNGTPVPAPEVPAVAAHAKDALRIVHRIEFTDASLDEVVDAVERTYGVKVGNVTPCEQRLTLSYDGNAADLISIINEILGTRMTVSVCEE